MIAGSFGRAGSACDADQAGLSLATDHVTQGRTQFFFPGGGIVV